MTRVFISISIKVFKRLYLKIVVIFNDHKLYLKQEILIFISL